MGRRLPEYRELDRMALLLRRMAEWKGTKGEGIPEELFNEMERAAVRLRQLGERINGYRGWASRLACAVYNGEAWGKQQTAAFFHMGDSSLSYEFPGDPPEALTQDQFEAAMDAMFERKGI